MVIDRVCLSLSLLVALARYYHGDCARKEAGWRGRVSVGHGPSQSKGHHVHGKVRGKFSELFARVLGDFSEHSFSSERLGNNSLGEDY